MFRIFAAVVALVLLTSVTAASADHSARKKKSPVERAIKPAPPSQPAEVKIVSMPAVPAPQVHVDLPKDDSAANLVRATWALFGVTLVLAFATYWVGQKQSRDLKRRDRDAMMREVSRAAHNVISAATRVEQIAKLIPPARDHLHVLLHQGGMPPQIKKDMEDTLTSRCKALQLMVDKAKFVLTDGPDTLAPLEGLSDGELSQKLWMLDAQLVRLGTMREAITQELEGYQAESARLREQRVAMYSALLSSHPAAGPPRPT